MASRARWATSPEAAMSEMSESFTASLSSARRGRHPADGVDACRARWRCPGSTGVAGHVDHFLVPVDAVAVGSGAQRAALHPVGGRIGARPRAGRGCASARRRPPPAPVEVDVDRGGSPACPRWRRSRRGLLAHHPEVHLPFEIGNGGSVELVHFAISGGRIRLFSTRVATGVQSPNAAIGLLLRAGAEMVPSFGLRFRSKPPVCKPSPDPFRRAGTCGSCCGGCAR